MILREANLEMRVLTFESTDILMWL